MAIKPILFNTEMITAILEGRKTQTRRVVKPVPFIDRDGWWQIGKAVWPMSHIRLFYQEGDPLWDYAPCKPGDILWVRETWHKDAGRCMYRANYADDEKFYRDGKEVQLRWSPSIHMPKEAARIFLRVKDVRVERLQEITKQDAISEGISRLFDHLTKAEYEEWANRSGVQVPQHEQPWKNCLWHGHFGVHGMGNRISNAWPWQLSGYANPCGSFSSLWNSTVQLKEWDKYGWDANPWVWVIEFERCEKPEGWH